MKTIKLFTLLAALLCATTAWAQTYITDVLVIGDPTQSEASDRYDSFELSGWTGINHNLNSGTDGYYIYLMYKTENSPYSSGTPISDLYLRVSESNDAPVDFAHEGRIYHRAFCQGNPHFWDDSHGDLNCGASGKYIHLYYTKDAFSPGRVVTNIAIDNTENNTAVGENGGTSPCDLNKGAGGDFIYLHMSKSMTGDVAVLHTEAELLDALTLNNANIRLGNDIYLSTMLDINNNKTITIDLNGYALDRELRERVSPGQVFNVVHGSTLNLSNGIVTGGWGGDGGAIQNKGTTNLTGVIISDNVADDRGGGIGNISGATLTMTNCTIINNTCNDHTDPKGGGGLFNAAGATATLTNVTITGNSVAEYGGGGICNYGTLTLDGGTITGNSAKSDGAGIWNDGTLNIQGAMTITGNTLADGQASNIYLKSGKVVTVTGSLTGSNIGIYMQSTGTFTNGYSTYHSGTSPATIFASDQNSNVTMDGNGQEALIELYYIERGWDADNNVVTEATRTLAADGYTVLNGGGDAYLNAGFYVVEGNVTYDHIYMQGGGVHHLILCDGAELRAKHINAESYATLHIYGQIKELGKIVVQEPLEGDGGSAHAGIGGRMGADAGTIVIHGGAIHLSGGYDGSVGAGYGGAGIGGGAYGGGGKITIYGGFLGAWAGSDDAAGIGGGRDGNGSDVTIHGGHVVAIGEPYGPGIGCGYNLNDVINDNGSLTVTGGHVEAYGGENAAGIGGGRDADGGYVTISGGYVYAKGGSCAAGIGSGCEALTSNGVDGGYLTITGGHVEAYGGVDAAGIGGGEDADGGEVTISGGYVYAEGKDGGAGIGGGEQGTGGIVTINGGTVIAKAGENATGYRAIGPGYDNDIYGFLTIGNGMMVRSADGTEGPYPADSRKEHCWYRTQARIEPCTHEEAGRYSILHESLVFWDGCPHCGLDEGTLPFTFLNAGDWDRRDNWLGNVMPNRGNNVVVKAAATIPNGTVANVGDITLKDGGSITIAEGGQLIHSNAGVRATVQKEITSWTDVMDHYCLMALPFTSYTVADSPLAVNAPAKYDLYTFNGSKRHREWRWHPDALANGQGFLYADSIPDEVSRTLSLTGTLVPGNTALSIDLAYYDNATFGGWNLVGNPFACNATLNIDNFYVINGTELIPASGPVAPLQGIFVKATGSGQSVTFTPGNLSRTAQALNIRLSKADSRDASTLDLTRIRFDESEGLEKFMLNPGHTQIYIPQDGKDYAVVSVGRDAKFCVSTEIPINFKAMENGRYTLGFNLEGIDFNYLHLIDNLTGADVDLLHSNAVIAGEDPQSPALAYTFTAKTTDYVSRFKLVFVCGDANDDNDAPFAFISNGEIVVNGEGTLQIIDVMGRVIISRDAARHVSTNEMSTGVYVLRLINGENVRTQKIVVE